MADLEGTPLPSFDQCGDRYDQRQQSGHRGKPSRPSRGACNPLGLGRLRRLGDGPSMILSRKPGIRSLKRSCVWPKPTTCDCGLDLRHAHFIELFVKGLRHA